MSDELDIKEMHEDKAKERPRWTDEKVVIQSAPIEATPAGEFYTWGTDADGTESDPPLLPRRAQLHVQPVR